MNFHSRLHVRDKADNDRKNFDTLLKSIKGSGSGKTLGVITKDLKFPGAFMDAWRSFWNKNGDGIKQVRREGFETAIKMCFTVVGKHE